MSDNEIKKKTGVSKCILTVNLSVVISFVATAFVVTALVVTALVTTLVVTALVYCVVPGLSNDM